MNPSEGSNDSKPTCGAVGRSLPHDHAIGHVTGTARYICDEPRLDGELIVGVVGSPVAAGQIDSIDTSKAVGLDGIVAVLTSVDLPGPNLFGPICADEPILAHHEVLYVGQPVVLIAGETREAVEQAKKLVTIHVTATEPILSIERAIELGRFLGGRQKITRGNASSALDKAPHRLSGVFRNGGQEQLYFEAQSAIAYPEEQGQIRVLSSTQNVTHVQHDVAHALGLSQNQVTCVCKRMGGGFGGKETQASLPAIFAALVAARTRRPARLIYDREQDMRITGKRHPYRTEWEAGFDDDGRILAYRVLFYSDGGASTDLSPAVLGRSMFHATNGYFIPDVDIQGQVCFTNTPSNTAFRGFGGPQGMVVIESVIHAIAEAIKVDPFDVRMRNLYGVEEQNITPYGQRFDRNHLPEILRGLARRCEYWTRLAAIQKSNIRRTTEVRGIALSTVMFGISFTNTLMNQGSALVLINIDGTVQVSTGGNEMGQGLITKIRQLVADALGVKPDTVIVGDTSTAKTPNTSPTAASASTDLNGAAAEDACRQIRARLTVVAASLLADMGVGRSASPTNIVFRDGIVFDNRAPSLQITFKKLCEAAYAQRVDLGARGFYATPGIGFNRDSGQGTPFHYFVQGAAAAEVVVDLLTGQVTVPRVDLLIDIGKSINPGVDKGQVLGGFMQGLGWTTMECLVRDDQGRLLTASPTTYKIPASTDLPKVVNVTFFDNDDNVEVVGRSKATGEPPLMLALSVWCAVRNALSYLSQEAPQSLSLPATGEEVLRCIGLGKMANTPPF